MRLLGHLLLLIALALASAWCAGWHWACCCGDGCTDCSDCATNCNDNESITLDISIVSYDGTECDCASGVTAATLAKDPGRDCDWGGAMLGSSNWWAGVTCRERGGLYRWEVYLEHACSGGVDCSVRDSFMLCEVDCSDGHPAGGPWRLDFGGTHNLQVDLTIT
jgi:hypothetical protein